MALFFLCFYLFFLKNLQVHQPHNPSTKQIKNIMAATTCHGLTPVLIATCLIFSFDWSRILFSVVTKSPSVNR